MAIPNVLRPQVESHGAGRPELRQRWHRVKEVTAMPYSLGETYVHLLPVLPVHLKSHVKMSHNPSHRIYQHKCRFWPIRQV